MFRILEVDDSVPATSIYYWKYLRHMLIAQWGVEEGRVEGKVGKQPLKTLEKKAFCGLQIMHRVPLPHECQRVKQEDLRSPWTFYVLSWEHREKPQFLLSFKELFIPSCVYSIDLSTLATAHIHRPSGESDGTCCLAFSVQMTFLISVSLTVKSSRTCHPKLWL